jgi:hypothetical protein
MRDLLTKHGIPTASLAAAVAFLNDAPASTITAFNAEFRLTPTDEDALSVARFAADAVFKGATAVDKVVGYVAKRMLGAAPAVDKPAPVVMTGVPVLADVDVVVAPVLPPVVQKEAAPAVTVKGRRGRKRLGNSDFCKAVAAIESAPAGAERATLLDLICAQASANGGTIKRSSAVVYYWRYHTLGERE